jgi:hypothetical protein
MSSSIYRARGARRPAGGRSHDHWVSPSAPSHPRECEAVPCIPRSAPQARTRRAPAFWPPLSWRARHRGHLLRKRRQTPVRRFRYAGTPPIHRPTAEPEMSPGRSIAPVVKLDIGHSSPVSTDTPGTGGTAWNSTSARCRAFNQRAGPSGEPWTVCTPGSESTSAEFSGERDYSVAVPAKRADEIGAEKTCSSCDECVHRCCRPPMMVSSTVSMSGSRCIPGKLAVSNDQRSHAMYGSPQHLAHNVHIHNAEPAGGNAGLHSRSKASKSSFTGWLVLTQGRLPASSGVMNVTHGSAPGAEHRIRCTPGALQQDLPRESLPSCTTSLSKVSEQRHENSSALSLNYR